MSSNAGKQHYSRFYSVDFKLGISATRQGYRGQCGVSDGGLRIRPGIGAPSIERRIQLILGRQRLNLPLPQSGIELYVEKYLNINLPRSTTAPRPCLAEITGSHL
ncbi:hypothetical protein ACFQAT_03820 [Undibacterium arcticum]|uniref:PilZ domain-containing protein n=1 Tax=Undibacterium arcticum TaxID=1762892 RepID=A0ABV7F297_9BURK